MSFCGQCGYQLRPNDTACPHCGMVTEPMLTSANTLPADDTNASNADSPTVAIPGRSPANAWPTYGTYNQTNMPTSPNTPPPPHQPFILPPVDNATNAANTGNTVNTDPSSYPGAPISYPGYPVQNQTQPAYLPPTTPGVLTVPPPPKRRGRGPIYLALILLLIVLVAAGAAIWFLLYGQSSPTGGTSTPTPNPTLAPSPTLIPSPTLTPSQHAQAVITQYYNDINNRDYQDAYNLLGPTMQQNQSYNNFVSGYAHTHHDAITISSVTPQSDGTYMVSLTIKATEDASSGTGTQISTYQGSDIVGLQNGTWKILSGNFQKVSTVPG